MKQRKVKVGRKKWHAPKVTVTGAFTSDGPSVHAPLPTIDEEFNYHTNRARLPGTPIRWGSDYWPVDITHRVTRVQYGNNPPIEEYPVMERINATPRPDGCSEIWHMLRTYGDFEEAPNRVWAIVVRAMGGGMRDVFIRAGIREIKSLPFEISQIVSQNIRPLNKIRFPACEYFIPERDFLYIGYPYR